MTYKFDSIRGVLDSDPKGLSGRGTQFYIRITDNEGLDQYHNWHLLDELEGKFDLIAIKSPFVKRVNEEQVLLNRKEADNKVRKIQDRINNISINIRLEAIISEVIKNNQKTVLEFLNGKEKALNSLIGQIINISKKEKGNYDAFTISTLLRKSLKSL